MKIGMNKQIWEGVFENLVMNEKGCQINNMNDIWIWGEDEKSGVKRTQKLDREKEKSVIWKIPDKTNLPLMFWS